MGKKSRRKKVTGNKKFRPIISPVARPFEGMDAEAKLVAMHTILPAATLAAKTTEQYGSRDFYFATLLPDAAAAMIRRDGVILIGLQRRSKTRDAAHDLGVALVAALDRAKKVEEGAAEPGLVPVDVRDAGPRVVDMVESTGEFKLFHEMSFWVADDESDQTVLDAVHKTSEELVPTEAILGVEDSYWHHMGEYYVRWVRTEDEHDLFSALARLQAARELSLGMGDSFIGAFRADGISIPVFEFPGKVEPAELTEPIKQLNQKLEAALANTEPLTDDEKRARAGLVSRQVSV